MENLASNTPAGYGRAAGLTDEVKQSVDPVRTGYRKHRGGSGHTVHGTVIHYFSFSFFRDKKKGGHKKGGHRDFFALLRGLEGRCNILTSISTPTGIYLRSPILSAGKSNGVWARGGGEIEKSDPIAEQSGVCNFGG